MREKSYYDVFAGIGLVDYALIKSGWNLKMALDYDQKKYSMFEAHFNGFSGKYVLQDIFGLKAKELPYAFLGHASFPCTDVSTAGRREGVQEGNESSAIDSFIALLYSKKISERPEILLTENVKGLLTSKNGRDIRYLLKHYNQLGYSNDLFLVDARHFVPQSRERVFILSMKEGIIPTDMLEEEPSISWIRPRSVMQVIKGNSDLNWSFLLAKEQPQSTLRLEDIIVKSDTNFWDTDRTDYLYSQMFQRHKKWVEQHKDANDFHYATAFRRTRIREGKKQATVEIRTDNIAGCLRTAKGGSAKQILLRVGQRSFNARLLNEIECARLMGVPEFTISSAISVNDYLFGFGDGVCASVIEWIDHNYLTPIYNANISTKFEQIEQKRTMKKLTEKDQDRIINAFANWCNEHSDTKTTLPIKGRLYGALVVLDNFLDSSENEPWGFKNSMSITTTDKGDHFGDRSIKNHTGHKIKLALNKLGRDDLIPTSGGEAGRTSTGTKRAGLGIIRIVVDHVSQYPKMIRKQGEACVNLLNELVVAQLDKHAELGGIEVSYSPNETVGNFLSKVVHYPSTNPGAILQHLVGAKLELRYTDYDDVIIEHNNSSTADSQTNRRGDFDIGNSVIHVTKSPTLDHFKKALRNAESGRVVYILIPSDRMGAKDSAKDIDSEYVSKVNVFSVEQFISQNLDELGAFQKEMSLENLKKMLEIYNGLIDAYENDNSLKVILPDFGD